MLLSHSKNKKEYFRVFVVFDDLLSQIKNTFAMKDVKCIKKKRLKCFYKYIYMYIIYIIIWIKVCTPHLFLSLSFGAWSNPINPKDFMINL